VFATLHGLAGRTGPITLTHTGTGIQLRIEGNAPFEKVNVWGMSRVICPEPFIRIRLKPGESKTWFARYILSFAKP
jgi:hypothetical protein